MPCPLQVPRSLARPRRRWRRQPWCSRSLGANGTPPPCWCTQSSSTTSARSTLVRCCLYETLPQCSGASSTSIHNLRTQYSTAHWTMVFNMTTAAAPPASGVPIRLCSPVGCPKAGQYKENEHNHYLSASMWPCTLRCDSSFVCASSVPCSAARQSAQRSEIVCCRLVPERQPQILPRHPQGASSALSSPTAACPCFNLLAAYMRQLAEADALLRGIFHTSKPRPSCSVDVGRQTRLFKFPDFRPVAPLCSVCTHHQTATRMSLPGLQLGAPMFLLMLFCPSNALLQGSFSKPRSPAAELHALQGAKRCTAVMPVALGPGE